LELNSLLLVGDGRFRRLYVATVARSYSRLKKDVVFSNVGPSHHWLFVEGARLIWLTDNEPERSGVSWRRRHEIGL